MAAEDEPPGDPFSRRAFLHGAAGLAALGSFGGILACGGAPLAPIPLREFSSSHRALQHQVLRGVNSYTGLYGTGDPTTYRGEPQASYDFLASRGLKVVRLPFQWGLLQPQPGGALDPMWLAGLRAEVRRIGHAGLVTVLDCHGPHVAADGTMRDLDAAISTDQFSDLWIRLSAIYRDDPTVIAYDIMNEPRIDGPTWERFSTVCVRALRAAGDDKLVWVGGARYSAPERFPVLHARPWIEGDPDKVMYSAHEYLAPHGRYQDGFSYVSYRGSNGVSGRLHLFTSWLVTHNARGSIGEMGWPSARRATDWREWNRAGERWYEAADRARLWVTYFCATSAYDEVQVAYDAPRNAFPGIPGISRAETQSRVIEAHPSRPATRTS